MSKPSMPASNPSFAYINKGSQNGDPNNWEWTRESRRRWELAEEPWREFRSKWYGAESRPPHGGSVLGSQDICAIVTRLKDQLSDGPPPMKARKMAVGQTWTASKPLV
ncbi:hypothetical protein M413DRAFT_445000, partial [Hebeloma cylindrosporum]